jgi:hypothetical protein
MPSNLGIILQHIYEYLDRRPHADFNRPGSLLHYQHTRNKHLLSFPSIRAKVADYVRYTDSSITHRY